MLAPQWTGQFVPIAEKPAERKPRIVKWRKQLQETSDTHVPFYKSPHVEITLNSLAEGETIEWETHDTDQIVMVVEGKLDVQLRDKDPAVVRVYTLNGGESIEIKAGTNHRLNQRYSGATKFVSVYPEV